MTRIGLIMKLTVTCLLSGALALASSAQTKDNQILVSTASAVSFHTTSGIKPHVTNSIGDYNRALDDEKAPWRNSHDSDHRMANHRKIDFWKRGNILIRQDDDPAMDDDFDPNMPEYTRWIRPPDGPRQVYGCLDKAEGLEPLKIKKTGRYIMWQLQDSKLIFRSQSTDPQNPCFPVFCYEEYKAIVGICNKRPEMENTVSIYGYEVGRMVWEMGVWASLDRKYLEKPWEGGTRPCQSPDSVENMDTGSYVAWTGWSEDQWEITVSKESEGCKNWRGDPNWVTTGQGKIPNSYPINAF